MDLKYRHFSPAPFGLEFEIDVNELNKYGINILTYPPSKESYSRLVDNAMMKYCSEFASEEDIQMCNDAMGVYFQCGVLEEEIPHTYLDSTTSTILHCKIFFYARNVEQYTDLFTEKPIHDIRELLTGGSTLPNDMGENTMLNEQFGNGENFPNNFDYQHAQNPLELIERMQDFYDKQYSKNAPDFKNARRYTPASYEETHDDLYQSANTFIFEFTDIENVIECAKGVSVGSTPLTNTGRLYHHEGKYYLALDILNSVPDSDVRNFLSRLTEYGKVSEVTKEVMFEYYKEIIGEDAVSVLAASF